MASFLVFSSVEFKPWKAGSEIISEPEVSVFSLVSLFSKYKIQIKFLFKKAKAQEKVTEATAANSACSQSQLLSLFFRAF